MTVEFKFKYDDKSKEELYDYELKTDEIAEAFARFLYNKFDIAIDGKDNDIYSLAMRYEDLEDDEDFIDIIKTLVKDKAYDEWKDDYEYINDLGDYADTNESLKENFKNSMHEQLEVNAEVKVVDKEDPLYDYTGVIESIENGIYTVLINFDNDKKIRQDYYDNQLVLI